MASKPMDEDEAKYVGFRQYNRDQRSSCRIAGRRLVVGETMKFTHTHTRARAKPKPKTISHLFDDCRIVELADNLREFHSEKNKYKINNNKEEEEEGAAAEDEAKGC